MPDDLQRRLDALAGRVAEGRADIGAVVEGGRSIRRRRMLMTGVASVLVLALGGAGAWALLYGPRYSTPNVLSPAKQECENVDFDLAIYLRDDITDNERAELRQLLESDEAVEGVREVSKAEAFEEFKRFYEDQPEFYENLPRDALPAFIEVTLTPPASEEDRRRLTAEVRELPGVDGARSAQSVEASRREACEDKDVTRYYVYASQPDVQSQQGYISFEVEGTIDVDAAGASVCIEGHFQHMVASHIVEATRERPVVLTLFEQPGDPLGPEPFSRCAQADADSASVIGRLVSSPEDFLVDFHHEPEGSDELISPLMTHAGDACSAGVPIVEALPDEARIGERVRLSGRCMFEEVRGTKESVFLSAMTDHRGEVLPDGASPRDGLPPCDFGAAERGKVHIDEDGNLTGFLVVPSEGTCFQEDSDEKVPVLPGYTYWITVACHNCRYGVLRVVGTEEATVTKVVAECWEAEIEPEKMIFTCADAGFRAEKLEWLRWGRGSAIGTGTFLINDCDPGCAGGTMHERHGEITLRGRSYCETVDAYVFTEGHVTFDRPVDGRNAEDIYPWCPPEQ